MDRAFEDAWREVSPHLDQVLDLEPGARMAWLQDLEARKPAIGAQVRAYLLELQQLEAEDFLGTALNVPLLSAATLTGQRFGSYTLDQLVGHGGTGTVWLAHRSDGRFEGQVAVKLLNAALVGHPSELRFAREGSFLARLRHPHIAQLLDAGVAAGNQPYLVLEYVRGERIDLYCQKHNLNVDQCITLFLDVLAAVAHAHRNLIVHRDLKPLNILVAENGAVKLLDFGVAALLSSGAQSSVEVTRHVALGLTPGYAAPEQLLGEAVTTATDVYALGLVLFMLLAGRHPVAPENRTAAELIRLTLDSEAPKLSDMANDPSRRKALCGDLDNILAMALRRNPAERYSTVERFAADLRRYLVNEPVSARPRSFRYVAAKFARRHRTGVAIAVVVTTILIGAVFLATLQMLEAQRQRDAARYQTRRAETAVDFLELLMMSDLAPGKPPPTFHDRLELGVKLIGKQYRNNPPFAGRMLVELAGGFRDDQEINRANELYAQAYDIGRSHHDVELMAAAQCNRAFGEGRADIREGVLERIEEGKRLLKQLDHPDVALQTICLMASSIVEQRRDNSPLAEALLIQAKKVLEADGSTYRQDYASVLNELAQIYLSRNQPLELLRTAQLISRIHEANGRGGTDAQLIARQNAATALNAMGEVSAAFSEREIVDRQARELEGAQSMPVMFAVNYASSLSRMARPREALKVLEEVHDRARKSGDRFVLAQTLLGTGWAYIQVERWDDANRVLTEAASFESNSNTRSLIQSQLAQLDLLRGDLPSAHRHIESALQLAGYRTGKPLRALGRVLNMAARVALAESADAKSEQFARDALAISETVARGPDTSADVGEALLRLAQAKVSQGATGDVRVLLERALKCLTNGLSAGHPLTVEARELLNAQIRGMEEYN